MRHDGWRCGAATFGDTVWKQYRAQTDWIKEDVEGVEPEVCQDNLSECRAALRWVTSCSRQTTSTDALKNAYIGKLHLRDIYFACMLALGRELMNVIGLDEWESVRVQFRASKSV